MKKLFLASFILASVIACGDNASDGGTINSEGTSDTSTINSGGTEATGNTSGANNLTDTGATGLDTTSNR